MRWKAASPIVGPELHDPPPLGLDRGAHDRGVVVPGGRHPTGARAVAGEPDLGATQLELVAVPDQRR
jgi:hypothetical protein